MKKRILLVLMMLSLLLLAGCKKDDAPVTEEDSSLEDSTQTEDLLSSAHDLAYKMIFEEDNPVANDMGTYVETLSSYEFDNIQYEGNSVQAIQLFWQCEGGKSIEGAAWLDKDQWAVTLYYDDNGDFVDLEAIPCEYSMVTSVLSTIKLMDKEEGVNLLYDIYIDDDYASLVTKEEFTGKWNDYTNELGNYVDVKTLFYHYNTSLTYPYVTTLLEFEEGEVYYSFYLKPGTIYIFNIDSGIYDETFQLAINSSTESYVDEEYWLEELENFSDSEFDLTDALTGPSLKDSNKDYFKIGAGIYGSTLDNCAINSPEHMIVAKKHFNSVTMTNLMKPSYLLDQRQSIDNSSSGIEDPGLTFNTIDKTLQWCQDNDVQMRGHTLVWHNQTPDWFFKEGYKSDGELVDRETMEYRLESFIQQYLAYVQENYPGVVYCWDVVNEAVEPSELMGDKDSFFYCRTKHGDDLPNLWYEVIGEDYVELAFTYARKYADEDVALIYNDYGTFDTKKLENIYKLCDHLNQKGLIDGIGMQGYWGISSPDLGTLKTAINKYAELGLEIHITELSIDAGDTSEEAFIEQGNRYASIMRLLQTLDTDGGGKANITSLTFFGLMDGFMLYDNDTNTSRLFDKDLQKKPAFNHIMETFNIFY